MHMHVSTLLVNTFNSHLTFPDQHIFMEIRPRDTYIFLNIVQVKPAPGLGITIHVDA